MSSNRKSILIGMPCYHGVSPEVLEDMMRFAFHCGRRMPQYDFFTGIKPKSEQFRARNTIVDQALAIGVDWVLFLDDDMVVNINNDSGVSSSYDFLERLLAHDKDIVGGLYYQRHGECAPVAMVEAGAGYRFLRDDEITRGLQQVDVVGGGCMLVSAKALLHLPQPVFEPEFSYGTDVQLCRKAKAAGYTVWLDSSVELGHVREERTVITSRNRHQFLSDTMPGEVRKFIATDIFDRLVADAEEYTGISRDMFGVAGNAFLDARKTFVGPDIEWYKTFSKERVVRQVWYNKDHNLKRQMTEYILTAIDHKRKLKVLDFGCGIGITAFAMAERGHDVTAMDLNGTGTIEFLRWRRNKYNMDSPFIQLLDGPPPVEPEKYDVIIAMDCLEHIKDWPHTLAILGANLKPGGVFFSNNAILDDDHHPEHYHLDNGEFVAQCARNQLLPLNQISYVKKEEPVHAV